MSECGICSSPDRELIERAMREGAGRRTIGRQFGVSPDAAGRHQKHHLVARPEPEPAPAVEPAPAAPDTGAPAEPDEIAVAAAPYFRLVIGDTLTVLQAGRILEGFSLAAARKGGCPLRAPTPAELQRHQAELRGRAYLFTPAPPPPPPPAKPPLRVPDPAEAAQIVLVNPLAVADMLQLELAERAAIGRLGAPHSLTQAGFARFSRELAEAGDDRGAKLIVVISAVNHWRTLAGQDLRFLRHAEAQQRLAALPAARGFDAAGYLRQLATRGVTITADGAGGLRSHPVGSLNPTDRAIISAHHAAILAACQAFERI